MDFVTIGLLFVGGVLGASSLIVAKKPDAKELLAKLVPYQAGIGVALLAIGILSLLRGIGDFGLMFRMIPIRSIAVYGSIIVAILLGFIFGMPLIAQWIPGDSPAEQKASEMSKKLAPYQTILGLAAIGLSLLFLLFRLSILKPM
jgi:hypothetical protein